MAFWIEIILSYVLPFKAVYDTKIGISPFMSMHFNPLGLVVNGLIIYLILILCVKGYRKIRISYIIREGEAHCEKKIKEVE